MNWKWIEILNSEKLISLYDIQEIRRENRRWTKIGQVGWKNDLSITFLDNDLEEYIIRFEELDILDREWQKVKEFLNDPQVGLYSLDNEK